VNPFPETIFFVNRNGKPAFDSAYKIQAANQQEVCKPIRNTKYDGSAFHIQKDRHQHLTDPDAEGKQGFDAEDDQHAMMRDAVTQRCPLVRSRHITADLLLQPAPTEPSQYPKGKYHEAIPFECEHLRFRIHPHHQNRNTDHRQPRDRIKKQEGYDRTHFSGPSGELVHGAGFLGFCV